jgi:hypothetical protein
MKNGEKSLMVHKKLRLKRCPKTYMRVMLKKQINVERPITKGTNIVDKKVFG